eukprot:TRINITY_DN2313_c0_g1_i1.p1 TRINITY_DN2313_c0_g1~~TRINITY_DN2313_c0_g1_i1.p1  ORF type:complete len:346 (-),score=103.59 TRINITY_DN2313_c0_g1_i1:277-1218(-)
MDPRRRGKGEEYALLANVHRQMEREHAYSESLAEDLGEDFRLPISHRVEENLDTTNLEQASVDTHIPSNNIGYRLLQKMGWKGQGLGREEQGIVEPIKPGNTEGKLGLGKQEEDDFYTAPENVERRKLDVEIDLPEEVVKKREVAAEKEQKIKEEIKEVQRVFFCELCNKQYKLAAEFDVHLSSYDHNHKKRFKEMKESNRNRDDKQLREQREQLRQERDMARMAQTAEAQRQQQAEVQRQQQLKAEQASQGASGNRNQPLKFGLTGPGRAGGSNVTRPSGQGKVVMGSFNKKPRVEVKKPAIFSGEDSDEDS